MSVHDEDILDFDFVEDATVESPRVSGREAAVRPATARAGRGSPLPRG